MTKRMLIDASHAEETRVVVLDGNRLEDFDVETSARRHLKGNIYLAKVIRVEPSLQAAFVEYGGNRHGFLAFSEIHPDYYQIPVADRQRLVAQEAAEAREEAEEDDRAAARDDAGSPPASHPGPAEESPPEPMTADEAGTPARHIAPDEGSEAAEQTHVNAHTGANGIDDSGDAVASGPQPGLPGLGLPGLGAADDAAERPAGSGRESAQAEAISAGARRFDNGPDHAAASDSTDGWTARPDSGLTDTTDAVAGGTPEGAEDGTTLGAGIETIPIDTAPPEVIGGDADLVEDTQERRPQRRFLRNYKIQEVIRRRQIMLVQVVKEERGTKGAALTTYLSLAGRFCVLMPNSPRGGGISRKITSTTDRRRLKDLMVELDIPDGMGLIVRTAGANRPKSEIRRDCEYLLRLWDDIRDHTLRSIAPALIYEEASLIKRAIRDVYSRDIDEVLVDGEAGWKAAHEFMRMLMPAHAKKVQLWRDGGQPLFGRNQVEAQLDAILSPTVQLKSGGYLVINQTEALVAIDVNSGRSTRERGIEETALRTNVEAADEVARQLRLRDLAGLIVIDFIDMESKKHVGMVERRLKEALKVDRARIQVGQISHFGLMEMSRQRLRPSLAETSFTPCPHCGGTGHVRSIETAAIHVLREIEEEGARRRAAEIIVHVATPIAIYIFNHKRDRLAGIEARYDMRVSFAGDDSLIAPQTRIERVRVQVASDVPAAITPDVPPLLLVAPGAGDVEDVEEDDEEDGAEGTDEASTARDAVDENGEPRRRRRRRRRRGGRRDENEVPSGEASEPPESQPETEPAIAAASPPGLAEPDAAIPPASAPAAQVEIEPVPAAVESVSLSGPTLTEAAETAEAEAESARRRGRRGGRRRKREEAPPVELDAEQPPTPLFPIAGPTPADPFAGQHLHVYDLMDRLETMAEQPDVPIRRPAPQPVAETPARQMSPDAVAPDAPRPDTMSADRALPGSGAEAVTEPMSAANDQHAMAAAVAAEPEAAAPHPAGVPEVVGAAHSEPVPASGPPSGPPSGPASGPESVLNGPDAGVGSVSTEAESAIRPIIIGLDVAPEAEKKRGWWRR